MLLAHQIAMENDEVTADMVELSEFPELGEKYEVMGVPRTVINENFFVEGAVPEDVLMEEIEKAVQAP